MSNIYNETIIVLGSLRYQSAPDTDLGLKVPFVQSTKIGIEFDSQFVFSLFKPLWRSLFVLRYIK